MSFIDDIRMAMREGRAIADAKHSIITQVRRGDMRPTVPCNDAVSEYVRRWLLENKIRIVGERPGNPYFFTLDLSQIKE